jgi:hypothetical protein
MSLLVSSAVTNCLPRIAIASVVDPPQGNNLQDTVTSAPSQQTPAAIPTVTENRSIAESPTNQSVKETKSEQNTGAIPPPQTSTEAPALVDVTSVTELSTPGDGINDAMSQVTNVSQLRDVSPGDWAFEALRSLVERYGCIAGYPDGTFRGNRATSRYEFAGRFKRLSATS